ncbi:MAG: DbpA RNA binding domain-containing protein [Treponema sp.]|nr:DbpA RNA binding domain-containing protein [Treponema sp.]
MGYNRDFEINEEQIADFLANAADRVKTTENVDLLADLNKIFKQNVPLTLRKYVIAYMLKESMKHYHSFGMNKKDLRNSRSLKNNRNEKLARAEKKAEVKAVAEAAEERPHHERVVIDPDKATSIFIGIGKNRRVYPRDLVGILIAVGGLDRERIGDIKVLANYSFVQLYTEDAQSAIDKLNGYEYRGRKLAVSYSRQKTEDEIADEKAEAKAESAFASEAAITEADMAAEDAAAYAAAEKAAADQTPFGSN